MWASKWHTKTLASHPLELHKTGLRRCVKDGGCSSIQCEQINFCFCHKCDDSWWVCLWFLIHSNKRYFDCNQVSLLALFYIALSFTVAGQKTVSDIQMWNLTVSSYNRLLFLFAKAKLYIKFYSKISTSAYQQIPNQIRIMVFNGVR